MSTHNYCEACLPDGAHIADVIENPFATCERCGVAAEDAGAILEAKEG